MSVHKDCGETIRWAKTEGSGRWMPPLEFVGNHFIIQQDENGDSVAVQVSTYEIHNCDPDKMLAWQEYQKKIAKLKGSAPNVETGMSNWQMARERDREATWTQALKIPCSRCGVKKGKRCIDLAKHKRGIKAETKNPHLSRLEESAQ